MHRLALRFSAAALAAVVLAAMGAAPTQAADAELPEIAHTKRVLGNGLTLIVHEDHKAPIVGVNIWYHVGSKNERPGRTGFAHLFEHLMFNGSEHADGDWFGGLAKLGGTGVNGTTNFDRTNYFETVPKGALDATLWLESDRMGHLLGAIDQGKLDEQRGVVQNEKRQGENNPYSAPWRMFPRLLYPQGHPYSWSVIGSMEDLDAASVEDVGEWFRAYYGAANAVLVICGDVDTETVIERVEHFFGDIPPGPTVRRPERWVAKRTEDVRVSIEERVPQAQVHRIWATPEWGAKDAHLLELAGSVLARGEGSRLHQRLVTQDALATEVVAFQESSEIAGQFHIWVTVAPGADLAEAERVLDEELVRFFSEGPTADELTTERTQVRASFVRSTERVGGFWGKSDLLASSEVFGGRPDAWKGRLTDIAAATATEVRDAAKRWLQSGALTFETRPFGDFAPAKEGADRTQRPALTDAPDARFPQVKRYVMPSGLRVVLARRTAMPVVRLDLLVDAGFAADPAAAPGTASLVGSLLRSGTETRTAAELVRDVDRLGAELEIATESDTTRITLSTLRESLAKSVEVLADLALHPSFPADELESKRRSQLATIQQERVDTWRLVRRVLPPLLYGAGHPYAMPLTGTGTEAAVSKLTREDLQSFHRTWFRPGNATLAVTGDATLEELQHLIENAFGGWESGAAPTKSQPDAAAPAASRVYIIDRPGAPQSVLVAAQLVPPRGGADEMPLAVLNAVLGGSFIARLNMNLREDKHWSYGARSRIRDVRGPRVLSAGAAVQTDKTAESLAEMVKEMRGIAGAVPPTDAEIAAAKSNMTLTLPGRWESTRAVAESLAELVAFGLPPTYFDTYAANIRAVTPESIADAGKLIHPEKLVWLVIGDRTKVEQGVRDLGIGEVTVIDADGQPVE